MDGTWTNRQRFAVICNSLQGQVDNESYLHRNVWLSMFLSMCVCTRCIVQRHQIGNTIRFIANFTLPTIADIGKAFPISLCAAPYYKISTSFVHWYVLNWKYENCYTELCRKFLYFGIHNNSRLISKIFDSPHTGFIFLWYPFLKPKKWSLLDLPTLPHQSIYEHSPEKKFCSKMCRTEGYGFVRNWKCDFFFFAKFETFIFR